MSEDLIARPTTICRVGYCHNCFKQGFPRSGQVYLAFGSTRNNYVIYKATHHCHFLDRGFTPHIYQIVEKKENRIIFKSACSMDECDIVRKLLTDQYYYYVPDEAWIKGSMSLKQWNTLVLFKDTGYKI